jgi:hypothetical protein
MVSSSLDQSPTMRRRAGDENHAEICALAATAPLPLG